MPAESPVSAEEGTSWPSRHASVVVEVCDIATDGRPSYTVTVPAYATVADVIRSFFETHHRKYPYKYVSHIIIGGQLANGPAHLRRRVEELPEPRMDIVPLLPEVEAVLRSWFDELRPRKERSQRSRRPYAGGRFT